MPRSPLLGCIADDLTGATDLAGGLVREGMRVGLAVGVPAEPPDAGADAMVVALKSRSVPAGDAIAQSRAALAWLTAAGSKRIYFKYASTFDSTSAGNIGPVTEALQDDLGVTGTVACPAFPANGRTVEGGLLLIGGTPISETHMRNHPLNPMRDADLRRFLATQTTGSVGHLPLEVLRRGVEAARAELKLVRAAGHRHVIADAATDDDLDLLGQVVLEERLVTGASAVAAAMAASMRARGAFDPARPTVRPPRDGPAAVIAGSCSTATLEQVEAMAARRPSYRLDVAAVTREDVAGQALVWAGEHLDDGPILIASSAAPGSAARVEDADGTAIEETLARIAVGLVRAGVDRLVVAGGETSGAVVQALGLRMLEVGEEIEPGVPWVVAREPVELGLVLKSGNFGGRDFFERALEGPG